MPQADMEQNSILIVDDKPENLTTLTAMLGEQGYQVRPTTTGKAALKTIQKAPPDLILLDIVMPGMDGYEVCRRLKADDATRSIPILFMSALDDTTEKLKAFEVGGVDYITKPFQVEEVLARIQTHLTLRNMRRQAQAQNAKLEREIRGRQQTEKALQESKERYQRLVENLPVILYSLDNACQLRSLNRTGLNFFGYLRGEKLIGQPFSACVYAADCTLVETAFADAIRQQQPAITALQFRLFDRSDQLKWGELYAQLRYDAEGAFQEAIGIINDITAHKQTEAPTTQ